MVTYTQVGAGTNVALLDTIAPFSALTAGEGSRGAVKIVEDQVAIARTGFGTAGNYARLCRFPANAKVKKVSLFTDLSLVDGGTTSSALVLSVGAIFSDSTIDGTPQGYQGQWPTSTGIGGGQTTQGTTVAPGGTTAGNFIFGTWSANGTTGAFPQGETQSIVSSTTYGTPLVRAQTPLVAIFNFWDNYKNPLENLGWMDLIVVATTVYNTQPAAGYNLFGRVEYVD